MSTDERIADLAEVPTDDTLLFRVRSVGEDERPGDEADKREAILLRLADDAGDPTDDVVGWLNVCQHMTHIPLDKGSGAPVRDGEVVCANHGAMFDAASGECTYGPCEGAFLAEVGVTVDEGGVYLDDDAYGFAGRGPVPDDDDLSSDSNVIL